MAERLDLLRRERAAAERRLGEVRERMQRAELDEAEAKVRVETRSRRCAAISTASPSDAMATECPSWPTGTSAPPAGSASSSGSCGSWGRSTRWRSRSSRRCRSATQFLEAQLEDVKSSRRDLAKVIRAIDDEIVNVFAAAFADVAAATSSSCSRRCSRAARAGCGSPIPTTCSTPASRSRPGRRARTCAKLSLLSGGERSLTALAFLFAVFRSRPSPFYVMDEVEAALDDVNLHRFLDLVHEFRRRGAAAHREPPEAHDGGGRLPLRRHDAAGRLEPSGERTSDQPSLTRAISAPSSSYRPVRAPKRGMVIQPGKARTIAVVAAARMTTRRTGAFRHTAMPATASPATRRPP